MLFFLSKQGELAQLLLDARQLRPSQKEDDRGLGSVGNSGDEFFYDNEAEEDAASGGSVARETDKHFIYCSIGREIAELMRFLQLNGGCFVGKRVRVWGGGDRRAPLPGGGC